MATLEQLGETSAADLADQFRNIRLDSSNEWVVGDDGSPEFVTGLEAIAQDVRCRLRLLLGEWAFDATEGTAYLQKILGKVGPQNAQSEIARVVRATPGILAVQRVVPSMNTASRTLRVDLSATTAFGPLTEAIEVST